VTEYSDLPPRERVAKYRERAVNARKLAQRVQDEQVKRSYTLIAERWEEMARDTERRIARGDRWEIN
jgi:hypothetical protein